MNTQLVEIQPRELKFIFEVKKQSSCVVHLANLSDQYVAFKVKTTSPKKYCVRPNIGIIKPKSTCDFTVTMQAQKSAPSDMQCKDKFLIQSTVVPFGTTEDQITPAMFDKESKHIEETKLRVVLATAPNSPAKPPADVVLKHEASSYGTVSTKEPQSPTFPPVNGFSKQGELQNGVENHPPTDTVNKEVEAITSPKNMEESISLNLMDDLKSVPVKHDQANNKVEAIKDVKSTEEFRSLNVIDNMKYVPVKHEQVNDKVEAAKNVKNTEDSRSLNIMDDLKYVPMKHEVSSPEKEEEPKKEYDVEGITFKLTQEIEELRSKISVMDTKLVEAQHAMEKLNKEKRIAIHETETLKQQLAMSRTRDGGSIVRKVHVGFPPLFVCMVALVSLMLGLFFRVEHSTSQ